MNFFKIYIRIIFTIKVFYIILAVLTLYSKIENPKNKELIEFLKFYKGKIDFIFVALMSSLLIYLFYPKLNNVVLIDSETKLLLFLFGLILIITADWGVFVTQSLLFTEFKSIIGR